METGNPLQRIIGSNSDDAGDRDDPPEPTPQVESDVNIGGEHVLIPDEDDEVESDESVDMRRAACRYAHIGWRSFSASQPRTMR